jgi:hypothetical protein
MTSAEIKLQIFNTALRVLGMNRTDDVDNEDPSTTALRDLFDLAVEEAFEEAPWPFATVIAELEEYDGVADTPKGWDYVYAYPTNNAATVWCVYNETTAKQKNHQDFRTYYIASEGVKVIVSNLGEAVCEHTIYLSDMTIWSKKFIMAVSYKLAAMASKALTGDRENQSVSLMQMYMTMISDAKRVSAVESSKHQQRKSSYQTARG